MIERLRPKRGAFGTVLFQAHNWAKRSGAELPALRVLCHAAPHRDQPQPPGVYDALASNIDRLEGEREKGTAAAFAAWEAKSGRKTRDGTGA